MQTALDGLIPLAVAPEHHSLEACGWLSTSACDRRRVTSR